MANTFTRLIIHIVFGTKQRAPLIAEKIEERLHAYIGGIAAHQQMLPLAIGGTTDHVHILSSIPAALSVSKAVQILKGNSSRWIHETFPELKNFAWQEGYGAFSVSTSKIEQTLLYIQSQKEHHRTKSFQEEYLLFLKANNIEFNPNYVFE